MKTSVLLISRSEEKRQALHTLMEAEEFGVVAGVKGGLSALEKVDSMSPDIVVLVLSGADPDTFTVCERIYLGKPKCTIVLVADTVDVDSVHRALEAGATSLIGWPGSPAEFTAALRAAHSRKNTHLGALGDPDKLGKSSKVITVFGTKGGIGKTTIAVNLAVKLSQMGQKVALLDLDLQFGDVSVFLDLEAKDTLSELVRDKPDMDIDSIRSYMLLHASGVHVLCAPNSPELADTITSRHIEKLLGAVRGYYDYIIIDTPAMLGECTLTAIEGSSQVLFVLGLDISILRNARICLGLLESLQQRDKVMLVVNREVEGSVTIHDVQRIMDRPIVARFPTDWRLAVGALNRGMPLVQSAPNSALSRAIAAFAQSMVQGEAPARKKGRAAGRKG